MKWEMIVQSTFIWANYLLPNSPYCMIYLWWETERENWSWSLLGVKGGLERKGSPVITLSFCCRSTCTMIQFVWIMSMLVFITSDVSAMDSKEMNETELGEHSTAMCYIRMYKYVLAVQTSTSDDQLNINVSCPAMQVRCISFVVLIPSPKTIIIIYLILPKFNIKFQMYIAMYSIWELRYGYNKCHANTSEINLGDTVLIKQPKRNKFTTTFDPTPLVAVKGYTNSAQGARTRITRNVSPSNL